MDLNASYYWSYWPYCFSMIRTEGPEALEVMGYAVAICQHHLYMASIRLSRVAPEERNGES